MTNEELAQRIQGGDTSSLAELWAQTERFFKGKAWSLWTRYGEMCARGGVTPDDIVQQGYFALLDAIQAYDADGEYKLLTYAKFPLMTHFRKLCGIRTSKRDPLQVADDLNAPVDDDGDTELLDLTSDPNADKAFTDAENAIFNEELRAALDKALEKLPTRGAAAVKGRYLDCKAQGDIALEMGVSQSYVHSLEQNALKRLRAERDLRAFHDEVLTHYAMKFTGFKAWKESGMSSTERAAIKAEELTDKRRKARFKY
jgi:RNA polymerase sigma factor (sigma-70 family)